MLAVLLALAAAAGYGGSDFAAGLATRQASVVRVTVLTEVAAAGLLLCVIPFVSSQAPSLVTSASTVTRTTLARRAASPAAKSEPPYPAAAASASRTASIDQVLLCFRPA